MTDSVATDSVADARRVLAACERAVIDSWSVCLRASEAHERAMEARAAALSLLGGLFHPERKTGYHGPSGP